MVNTKNGKGGGGEDSPKLHEFGSNDRPDLLDDVIRMKAEEPCAEEPKELKYARTHRRIYVRSDKKPKLELEPAKDEGRDDTYSISVEVERPEDMHLLGQEAVREKPARLVKEINAKVGFESHRPDWMPAIHYPRTLPGLGQPEALRRFNGGSTRPLYVFGPDNRAAYLNSSWPWGLVGKVFTSDGKVGSAALIGPRIIATAGHVVPWGGGSWWMKFVPAYYNGSSLHGAGVESYVSNARGFDVGGSVTGYDWAVCRLYQPLGNWLGYFGYNGYSSSWQHQPYWTVLGYPTMVASGQRPSWQGSVSSFDTDSDSNGGLEIETKADMTPGNSGGPMFGWWNGDPRLIGVVSGQEEDWTPGFWPWEWGDTEKGNVVAGGSGFTNLMAWGRSNWPA